MKCYYNPSKQIDTNSLNDLLSEKEWCCSRKAALIAEKKEVPIELEQHLNTVNAYIQSLRNK